MQVQTRVWQGLVVSEAVGNRVRCWQRRAWSTSFFPVGRGEISMLHNPCGFNGVLLPGLRMAHQPSSEHCKSLKASLGLYVRPNGLQNKRIALICSQAAFFRGIV